MTRAPDARTVQAAESEASTFTVTVPGLPPAECSKNARVHWAVARKAAIQYKHDMWWAMKGVIPEGWHADKVRVSLVIQRPYVRRSDPDNWWTRFKAGMDALVLAGVVPNDDTEHVELGTVTHAKGPAETHIVIERILRQP